MSGRGRRQSRWDFRPSYFPLPRVPFGSASGPTLFRISWVNLLVWFLNLLNAGASSATVSAWPPSVAQQRCLDFLGRQVAMASSSTCRVRGLDTINACLRHSHGYSGGSHTLPLVSRAGVPPRGADVDLAVALSKDNPLLSRQVIVPEELLLPENERPELSRRPFTQLSADYDDFVGATVKSGLQCLLPR